MSKFNIGDKVRINNYIAPNGCMVGKMANWFKGKTATVIRVCGDYDRKNKCSYYNLDIYKGFYFSDHDLELVERGAFFHSGHCTKHIEVPVPGGHLVAEAVGGEDYPAIHIFFIASGDEVEHDLCFAEVCAADNPDVIRVGTYYADFEDVKDVFEYPMDVWREEDETLDRYGIKNPTYSFMT